MPRNTDSRVSMYRAKVVSNRRLGGGRKQVEPQPGRADRVGLLDDLVAPDVESRRRLGEREGDQETEQAEHRALDRPQTLERPRRFRAPVRAEAPPDVQDQDEPQEESDRHQERQQCFLHRLVSVRLRAAARRSRTTSAAPSPAARALRCT